MGINTVQVAWLSRLAEKGIVSRGQSIIEFSPQDVMSPRHAIRHYALRHNPASAVDLMLDEICDGEKLRPDGIPGFYRLFGIERYRCIDLLDNRADRICDFNEHVEFEEQFDLATNFGTAEHVFNIGNLFHSIHDALRTGGVALHVLPTFGDIDHGFYNIHPTLYLDLAAANNYVVEDIFYGDRWDIRNKILEDDLGSDVDFDGAPIQPEHMRNRNSLQRAVTRQFVANYQDPDTERFGNSFPSLLYDYCAVALRKTSSAAFHVPMQTIYGGGAAPSRKVAAMAGGREGLHGFVERLRRLWQSHSSSS